LISQYLESDPMKIGIDASPLRTLGTGIPRATNGILQALQRIDERNEYYLFSKYDLEFAFGNAHWHPCVHPRIPFLLGSLYLKQGGACLDGGGGGLDVFWMTRTYPFPFGLPRTTACVATVYDLVWRLYPETMFLANRITYNLAAVRSIRQAHRIISISESTSRDLTRLIGIPPDKITVVPLGVGTEFAPRGRVESARRIAEKYGASPDYICTVGTVEPRKNLTTLIEAVKVLRDRGQWHHQLLIAGQSGWKNASIYASVERFGLSEREVKFLGSVPEEDLPWLYSGAALFAFPSLYEGFGLPLLEAMACGAPVVAANSSSIPEVVEEAGILVSPKRAEEFAEAILRVTSDPALRETLSQRGLARARQFTWEAAAAKVLQVFEKAAQALRSSR
jgi:glycosyltransferase involved in cell wall biosynthesis